MAQILLPPAHPRIRSALPSMVTLALWRGRRTWHLLLLAGLGIVAAVTLVCTVPLYSEVALTAGLRSLLSATPQSAELTLQANGNVLTPAIVTQQYQSLNRVMQQRLGSYLLPKTELSIETPLLGIDSPAADRGRDILLYGAPMPEASQHIQVARGRLPQAQGTSLEIALTQETASRLHLDIGSTMVVELTFDTPSVFGVAIAVPMRVVGFIVSNPTDPFWHNHDFDPNQLPNQPPNLSALMSNDAFLGTLQQLAIEQGSPNGLPFDQGSEPKLSWYYYLNVAPLPIGQLNDLIGRLQGAQAQLGGGNIVGPLANSGNIDQTDLSGPALDSPGATGTLEHFRSRVSLVNIPVSLLLLQIVGLMLFFVGVITSLLVERQADAIALLRSRGASRRLIFGSFVTQGVGLALVALLVGPPLAVLAARLLAQMTLSPADQQAQSVITGNPVPVALTVGFYALIAALSAVVAMAFAVRGASRTTLEMRRESSRSTRQPFWQRIYLDVVAAIVALTGFALSLFISNSGALDPQTALVVAAPLALVAPIFLVIAGILLFLRFFPLLLQSLASLVSRRPGATPILALAQMARAPRQAIRMILLLALASSFASFALVFLTSETQHLQAMAAYEAGADFSGIPINANFIDHPAQEEDAYRTIPGVSSATIGFAAASLEPASALQFAVRAADATTFAQTAIWTAQDSSQPLASLMRQLIDKRPQARAGHGIPAIVDALTWQQLNLRLGATFTLQIDDQNLLFTALVEVNHIPTVDDSLLTGAASDFAPPGGILIDYQTLLSSYETLLPGSFLAVNYVWLRTSDDPALLAQTRAALAKGPLALTSLNDRRASLNALETDPLYLALMNVLVLGTAMTILLALLGDLIASWLSARTRLLNFAVLRALGTTPRQLASVLTWEQIIIYSTAIALGALFGALLAATIVPALVFTGVSSYAVDTSSGEFYTLQHLLPTQIVVPGGLGIVFAALVGICALAIGMMARVASQPSISQTLRLNAD